MSEFYLHYHISNNGDGSASLRLHPTGDAAEAADNAQQESGEGWGESSNGHVKLKLEDGALFYRSYERVDGKYQYVWIEVR
jgi:hypothetical protein